MVDLKTTSEKMNFYYNNEFYTLELEYKPLSVVLLNLYKNNETDPFKIGQVMRKGDFRISKSVLLNYIFSEMIKE